MLVWERAFSCRRPLGMSGSVLCSRIGVSCWNLRAAQCRSLAFRVYVFPSRFLYFVVILSMHFAQHHGFEVRLLDLKADVDRWVPLPPPMQNGTKLCYTWVIVPCFVGCCGSLHCGRVVAVSTQLRQLPFLLPSGCSLTLLSFSPHPSPPPRLICFDLLMLHLQLSKQR